MGTRKLGDLCAWQQMLEAYNNQELLKLGVPEALKFKSRFCDQHEPRSYSGNPQYLSKSFTEELKTNNHTSQKEGQIVEFILEKKCTRSGTYYKVRSYNACILSYKLCISAVMCIYM